MIEKKFVLFIIVHQSEECVNLKRYFHELADRNIKKVVGQLKSLFIDVSLKVNSQVRWGQKHQVKSSTESEKIF